MTRLRSTHRKYAGQKRSCVCACLHRAVLSYAVNQSWTDKLLIFPDYGIPHPLTYMHCSCSRFRSKLNVSIYKSTCCILLYNHEGIQNEPQICPVEFSCISRANVPCTFWGPRPGNQDVSLSPSTQVVPPLPLPLHSYSKTLVLGEMFLTLVGLSCKNPGISWSPANPLMVGAR